MVEISVELPQLRLFQRNDLLDFLHPLLLWLEQCGVQTTIQVEEKSRCDICKSDTSSSSVLGGICFLPPPRGANETVSSLLSRAYSQSQNTGQCTTCGSTLEREEILNSPDILTLSLPRALPDGSILKDPVDPSEFLNIAVSEDETHVYRLSSVICYSEDQAHFCSYLLCDHITIKADDYRISVVPGGRPEDIKEEGIAYFY